MTPCYNLALIGFGGVNRTLADLIARHDDAYWAGLGFRLRIVAVSDLKLGSVISANGIEARTLTETRLGTGGLGELSGGSAEAQAEHVIRTAPADIVVEATYTNPVDGTPAVSHCRAALESGRHVVTCNKGPVAHASSLLHELAWRQRVRFEFEGAVMSGTPLIRLARHALAGAQIHRFEGVLNGTTNFMLGRMEQGHDFASALAEAQALGYAEADPAADVEGHDVRLKVAILANELLGARLRPDDVECVGIRGLSAADVTGALAQGQRYKLVGSASRDEHGHVRAQVTPRALAAGHPLAGVHGAMNAASLHTRLLGPVTITGPGAGLTETAFALLSDIIEIHRSQASEGVQR